MNGDVKQFVPRLRFRSFKASGPWEFKPLSQLAQRSTRKNVDGKITRVLTNSAEYGVVDQRDFFEKDIANKGNLEGYYIVEEGSYVYNPRISTMAPVGPISKNKIGLGVMSPLYTVFKFNNSDNDFYAHYFKSTHWHQYMRQVSSTGARHDRMSISNNAFMELPLPVSTPEEQEKIADCLSSLDELLTTEIQKLDELKKYKKGLLQQIFPREGETVPRLRFPEFRIREGWASKCLKELCLINPKASELPEKFIYIDLESVEAGELKVLKIVERDDAPSRAQRLLSYGDVIYQIVRPYQRNNFHFKIEEGEGIRYVASTGYAQLRAKECSGFLFQAIHTDDFVNKVIAKCTGSSYPAINSSDLAEITLPVPSEEEQKRIADFLLPLDDVIIAQGQKIEALKSQKNGLTQQVFPLFYEVSE
ncbi:restriction endonuclease subunit S [Klebsiella pneumoniae]|uniref:restriction endonuclease subunit S n=1 Tax=Klebsiella pneumoniae TaxID=573 RepID=UPI0006525C2E|nr:restriction endonuclease subunit S [Klebsiella pneumoniae]HBQ5728314.1 restriction endonuclease subunit S [Klebsiella pneumoniae subsp. pneumoniae]KMH34084.1 hypothetical protein SM72_04763 [Klebsiella pneumoniae]MCB3273498.1 restriction endonuclease subunit S [Klebsiella pneumoniae]MEA4697000.1 restriction endonuclease subunit S [Klebsiella pneumoniae]MEC4336174.1 restriction endonuclease subunit S [Klebsiella pneumoniae]